MTRRQREQVVELLRCAADLARFSYAEGIHTAAYELDMLIPPAGTKLKEMAIRARREVNVDMGFGPYEDSCLEAAARIEEGSWP